MESLEVWKNARVTLLSVRTNAAEKGLVVYKKNNRYYVCKDCNTIGDFHYLSEVNIFIQNYIVPNPAQTTTYTEDCEAQIVLNVSEIEKSQVSTTVNDQPILLVWYANKYFWDGHELTALKEKDAVEEVFRRFGCLPYQVQEKFSDTSFVVCDISELHRDAVRMFSYPDVFKRGDTVAVQGTTDGSWGVIKEIFKDSPEENYQTVAIAPQGRPDLPRFFTTKKGLYHLKDAKTIIIKRPIKPGFALDFYYRGQRLDATTLLCAVVEATKKTGVNPTHSRIHDARHVTSLSSLPQPVTPGTAKQLKIFDRNPCEFIGEEDAIAFLDSRARG